MLGPLLLGPLLLGPLLVCSLAPGVVGEDGASSRWFQPSERVATVRLDDAVAITTIAAGSCIAQAKPIPTLDAALRAQPDVMLLLGDNVYADADDPAEIAGAYRTLAARPEFRRLAATVPILATWDDHDYGRNDAGVEFPAKAASQRVFLEFFDAPASDPRRARAGVYTSRTVGPEGRRVQFVLLDTRSFRDPLKLRLQPPEPPAIGRPGPYAVRRDGATVLGAAQWDWLEQTLLEPADVRIVASSIQVLSDEHRYEKWGLFGDERDRLLGLLETASGQVVVLSGDRHLGEISRDAKRGLWELTASSLNKPSKWRNERNAFRVGDKFHGANFGTVSFDWDAGTLSLAVRDERGVEVVRADGPIER